VASNNSFSPLVRVLPLQVQAAQWMRAYDNTIAEVNNEQRANNNTLAPEAIKLSKNLYATSWLVQEKQWSRAYDNTCAAAVEAQHRAFQALAPGVVALPLDLFFPEDFSNSSFKAQATTCPASLLEDACPGQQQALAALWAHLATCPGPVQVTIEDFKPQDLQCQANWTTATPEAVLDAQDQAVCPAAYFLGVNTTVLQALETDDDTGSIQKVVNTWVVCAAACCTLAGILATAMRLNKPSAPKEPSWKLEVLQAYSMQLTGDSDKDARWAHNMDAGLGMPGDGAKLLDAIRAAGLYPELPIKLPQALPTPPAPLRLSPNLPWAHVASPCRPPSKRPPPRVYNKDKLKRMGKHLWDSMPTSSSPQKTFTPKPPVASKPKTNRRQPSKPTAFFSKPARRAFIAELPSPGKPKQLQVPVPISEPPAPHSAFTFTRLAPSSPTLPIFGRPTSKVPEFSFHRHRPAATGSPTLPIFGKTI
jgi:hypothetical protein